MGQLHEVVSLSFMAVAMSMDAFSVSLGLGMKKLRLKRIAIIGLVIGVFHLIFPLIGMVIGRLLSGKIGELTTLFGGLLLVIIGAHMFFSAFTDESDKALSKIIQPVGFGLVMLSITVSIDSFTIGLSLGITGAQIIIALLLFSGVSVIFTWSGLLLGRKFRGLFGSYSELLGGSILISFGLKMIFG